MSTIIVGHTLQDWELVLIFWEGAPVSVAIGIDGWSHSSVFWGYGCLAPIRNDGCPFPYWLAKIISRPSRRLLTSTAALFVE